MDILKWLASFLPRDPSNRAGFGPFGLPSRCEWMQRAANLHDWDYDKGPKEGERLSTIDSDLFNRWVIEAMSCPDPMDRCHRIANICEFWPIARKAGHYLYDRGNV